MPSYKEKNAVKFDKNAVAQVPDLMEIMKMLPQYTEALPGVEALASNVNQFQQSEKIAQMERAQPGITANFGKAGEQIGQLISGAIPKDVQDRIQNIAAAKSMGAGVAGSSLAASGAARSFGLTSLDLIGQGIGQLLNLAPVVQGTMTVNPMDIEQNIPNMTDLFNALYTQETNRATEYQTVRALNEARLGKEQGAGVGGGGGAAGVAGSARWGMTGTDWTGAPMHGLVWN